MSKGGKPKKPQSKKVAALIEQLQRRRGTRVLAKRFLIVCEDEESAPNYFETLKRHFNLSAASIEVVGSGHSTQPIQIVERAIELMRMAARKESGTQAFGEVWCVIDGDYGDKIANARSKADAKGIRLAISTMCFEYWVLLHFEEFNKSTVDCDAIIRVLKKRHCPEYEKGDCDFSGIIHNVREASARAKKLRTLGIEDHRNPEDHNPCSEIYNLVDAIFEN